jgi:hypothetical protein
MAAHCWYTTTFAILAAALTPVLPAQGASAGVTGQIVVDQVQPDEPTNPGAEFAELRDIGTAAVDISNWQLFACDGAKLEQLATIPDGTVLSAKGQQGQFFLIASRNYDNQDAAPDLDFQYGTIPLNGGVLVQDGATHTVDSVGFSTTSPCTRIAPATVPPYGAVSRDTNSTDTGDNAVDFTSRPPDPHNSLG